MLGSGEVSDPPLVPRSILPDLAPCPCRHRGRSPAGWGGRKRGLGAELPPCAISCPAIEPEAPRGRGVFPGSSSQPCTQTAQPHGGGPVRGCLHPLPFWGHGALLEGDLYICSGVGTLPVELGAAPAVRASCRAAGPVLGAVAVAALPRGRGNVPDPQEGWPRPEAWVCVLGPAAVLPLLGTADMLIGQTPRGPPSASWYREVQETGALGTPALLKETSAPARVLLQEHGLGRERLLCSRS